MRRVFREQRNRFCMPYALFWIPLATQHLAAMSHDTHTFLYVSQCHVLYSSVYVLTLCLAVRFSCGWHVFNRLF